MVNSARRPTREQRETTADSNVLVNDLGGGLNVTSSGLNIPLGDTPEIRNVRVNEAGNWQTREGTQHLTQLTSSSTVGFCGAPYRTKAGYSLVVIKDKNNLRIYQLTSTKEDIVDAFSLLMTKTNVWSDVASNIKFDYVVTNEPDSRIIMTTGIAPPVQLQFFEHSQTITSASPISSFDINSESLEFALSTNTVVWVDGVVTPQQPPIYSTGVYTVNFATPLAAGTYFVDFVFITWQWWAEAALFQGSDLNRSVTRLDADIYDLSVAIPTALTRTFDKLGEGEFNIIPYQTTGHSQYYSFASNYTPTSSSTSWAFSQGVVYDPAAGDAIVPGISHVTFGAVPTAPEEVSYIKAQEIQFNGNTGIEGGDLYVAVDDNEAQQRITTASGATTGLGTAYYLRKEVTPIDQFYSTTSVETTTNTKAKYISFDATSTIGLSFSSTVRLVNTNDNGFAGSAAVARFDGDFKYRDGNLYPAYGLYEWADYNVGSFPRTVALFQGRLVFGGFPNKPLQVVFSNVLDSAIPDVFFNNFSVATEDLESTDAVAVFVSSVENDAEITAVKAFTDSLFVFTINKTIRIFGGSGSVTPSNILSSVIASVGALNYNSVQLVDNSVIFLSSNGLYQLAPSINIGDFSITAISTKITQLLKNNNNTNVAWVSYNNSDNEMFVAVTDNVASIVANRIYHLSLFRGAWTEYTLFYGRFNTSCGITVAGNQTYTLMSIPRSVNTVDTDFDIVSYPYFFPLDIAKETTAELSTVDFDIVAAEQFTYDDLLEIIPIGYRPLPFNFKDVELLDDGSALVFDTDYHKIGAFTSVAQLLALSAAVQTGSIILHYPVDETGKYPVAFFRDNAPETDFTVAVSTTTVQATVNFDNPSGTVKRYGYTYPCFVSSPLLVRQTIARTKNLKFLYVLIHNEQYLDVYTDADVNTGQSQDLSEILGMWKREVGLNVALRLDKLSRQFSSNQVTSELTFDVGRYDLDSPAGQSSTYAKVAYSLSGSANHIQALFYSFSSKVWEITGYELETRFNQRTSYSGLD